MTQDQRYGMIIGCLERAKGSAHLAAELAAHARIPTQHEHDAVTHLVGSIITDLKKALDSINV